MRKLTALALASASLTLMTPLAAQNEAPPIPGQADAARVTAGTYAADPSHSLVGFRVNHFGFNDYFGIFGDVAGTLALDPANLEAAKVDVTIPLSGLTTASAKLTGHMNGADFFDSGTYPAARFVSTKVTVEGTSATIEGNLTIKDVTVPVTLDAEFTGAGTNPFSKKETIGFEATTAINRSVLGMKYGVPLVSDEVRLGITVAFEKG